ncbi:MAG: hypothetical protein WAT09_13850 [Paracoccaceae bacterium]
MDETLAALKRGDLPGLAALTARSDAALEAGGACDLALAQRLQAKAQKAARMIAAASKGVKAARQRVQDLTTEGRFSTYDSGGRRDQVGVSPAMAARRL